MSSVTCCGGLPARCIELRLRAVSDATDTLQLVVPVTRATDTCAEATEEVARIWRSRTPHDRWVLLKAMDADVEAVARAGIVWAHPGFTEAEIDRELFRRRYGDQLARDALGPSRPD